MAHFLTWMSRRNENRRRRANHRAAGEQVDHELREASCFMNIRVADIHECYKLWKSRGAHFLTEPKHHPDEIRCYMRDPDGYLIEVGQTLCIREH